MKEKCKALLFEHLNMLILYDGQGFDMWTHVHVLFIVSNCNKRVISESVVYLCLNFAHKTKHLGFNHHHYVFFEDASFYHTMMLVLCIIACVQHIRPTVNMQFYILQTKKGAPGAFLNP